MSQCVDKNHLEFNQIKKGVACISKLKPISWLLFSISTVAECVPFPGHYRKLTSNPFLRACFHIFLVFSPCKQPITTYMYTYYIALFLFFSRRNALSTSSISILFFLGVFACIDIEFLIYYMPSRPIIANSQKKKKTSAKIVFFLFPFTISKVVIST